MGAVFVGRGGLMKYVLFDRKQVEVSKVVCVGRNYVEHIAELENEIPAEPVIFIKPNSAISDKILLHPVDKVHYESEITFLLVQGQIAGVGLGLDLTKREVQATLKTKGLPWERAKAFDNSAVFSEFIPVMFELSTLRFELFIDEVLVQQGGYGLMMYKPDVLLTEVSRFLSFEDGDLLMTGTPKGVGPLVAGTVLTGRLFSNERLLLEQSWPVETV